MVFKGRKDKGASDPRDESCVREALEALLDASGIETTRLGEETGSYQELTRRASVEARKGASGAPQSFFFLNDDERFLVVAPTATVLLMLDAFLGLDVEKLCDDDLLWRDLCESARKRPELTELEKEVLSVAAPRIGALNPRWFTRELAEGAEKPKWKTRFLGQNFQKGAELLDDAPLRWERFGLKLRGRVFNLLLAQPAATPVAPSPTIPFPASPPETTPIPLPDFDSPDEIKTLIARVAKGTIAEEEWRALKPGDVLTTDVPANSLFEALVDDEVVFLVKPGLFQGRPAVQFKERLKK